VRAGHPLRQTAALVGVHYVTLQTWLAWYRQGGLAEVRRHQNGGRQGRPSLLTATQRAQLAQQATSGTVRTARDVGSGTGSSRPMACSTPGAVCTAC
jgi:transposase